MTGRRAGARAVLLAALLALAGSAVAEVRPAGDPGLAAAGWRQLTFPPRPANAYRAGDDGAIEVTGEASVSMLFRPLDADPAETPILTWRWRVDAGVPPTDLARRGGDDRSLAVFVGFAWDPDSAGLMERLRRPFVEQAAGPAAPGRTLSFVWGGDRPAGARFASPYGSGSGHVVVLRGGDAPTGGGWQAERVDVAAAYRAAFGSEPTGITWIADSADGDDTGTTVRAAVDGLAFSPAPR